MERVLISKKTILFLIMTIIALMLAYYSSSIILISIIGIGFGVLIHPVLTYLRKKLHLPRALSALVVLLGIILIFAVVFGSMYYLIADQVNSLQERWPEIRQTTETWLTGMFDRFPWLQEQLVGFDFGSYFTSSASGLIKGFKMGIFSISAALIALVIGLYTAVNGGEYFDKTIEAFYPEYRKKARKVLQDCAVVIRAWFKAQLIDMVIIGLLTGLGLWIVGVEYWAVFGLLTAVLGIIPYVGIILVVTTTSLITLTSDPSMVPWVIGVFALTQQLEADVILPMVMKGGAQIPVVPLLIFMLFIGSFYGIIGIFIAPPLLAVLRTLYIEIYLPYIERRTRRVLSS